MFLQLNPISCNLQDYDLFYIFKVFLETLMQI